ncbi:hypothetical protein M0805_009675 [Coniferiporia weirii]|nr:hypothetical protein M0805_009675 [Coniferiporia weirii]
MNATPLRLWTLSSQCRLSAYSLISPACKRAPPKRLDAKFFSSTPTQVLGHTRPSPHSIWSQLAWKTPGPQTVSLLSLAEHFVPQRLLAFRSSSPAQSRLGWYRPRTPVANASQSSRSRGPRAPHDPPPPNQGPSAFTRLRRRFNQLPSEVVLWAILGLNGAVYFAWQYATDLARHGDPSLYIKMQRNILLSWRNIREGRIWTAITSTFSHSSASHIFLNGLTFYFMAPPVLRILGNSAFMGLYLFGGISCSMLSLLLNQSLIKREGSSNGASGAIFAVTSFFACVSPQTKFLLFFVVPVPAWAVITGLFIWDGLSALSDRRTQIDGAGHVGGILAGVAYYFLKRRMIF